MRQPELSPIASKRRFPHIISEDESGYQRCVRCVMDTTDPLITFDGEGVCMYCHKVEGLRKFWNPAGDPERYGRLLEKCKEDGKGREYDVIIGLSGGVDSSYVAHLAHEAGLRTLAIHCDTGWNSEMAIKNIQNVVSVCGFDFITHVVDWSEMRDLQHAFFKSGVPAQDIPQDNSIIAVFSSYARKHKIKWSLAGSNWATESILPMAWGHVNLDKKHILAIHKRFGTKPLNKLPLISFEEYTIVNQRLYGMKVATPLNLVPYDKSSAMELLKQKFDWRYYGGKHHESRFTKFFQTWYLPHRWGFDKRLPHLSSLIVSGQMTREGALLELQQELLIEEEFEADRRYMARKLQISDEQFEELMNVPLHSHQDYPCSSWLPLVRKLKNKYLVSVAKKESAT
ncbi:MAG: N-acetyl sugar amidotransferase [Fimbriimonadaceae bacterium]